MHNILAVAIVNGKIQCARLSLLGVHPLHIKTAVLFLTFGVNGKAVIRSLVVYKKHPDFLVWIFAVINRADTFFKSALGIIDRNYN